MADIIWINFEGMPRSTKKLEMWEIVRKALMLGYGINKIDKTTGMIRFISESACINVYMTTLTVTTELWHPKKGKTQLHRRGLTKDEVLKIFENPRHHTGKGYYAKKKK